jgi:dienelactone hydrolase
MIWNHGSEQAQVLRTTLARFYNARGLVFFAPHRRGHGESPGQSPIVQMRARLHEGLQVRRARIEANEADAGPSRDELMREVIDLHDGCLKDTIAAVRWLGRQPFIDPLRLYMSGSSHGGIQTLLAAEADVGMRAYVAFAPGAIGWRGNPELRERLLQAVRAARAPILILQAQNDFDLGPSRMLGEALRGKGGQNMSRLYPPYGNSEDHGHAAFACEGTEIWGGAVDALLKMSVFVDR